MRITREHAVVQVSFLPRLFPVNVYLVEEEDGFTLIDAGMPFSLKGILATAQSLGKPITRIILTHAHGDHVGALDGLKDALPKAEVCISRRDAPLLAGDATLLPGEPQTPVRGSVPKGIRTRPDRLLDDGDRIGSLVAIATPGHTPGHMAFMDTRSRVLIAGDAYQLHGGLAVSGRLRPLFPFPALATWNRELALASAKRLAELEPSVLAVGHGRMLRQPAAAMRAAAADAEQRLRPAGGICEPPPRAGSRRSAKRRRPACRQRRIPFANTGRSGPAAGCALPVALQPHQRSSRASPGIGVDVRTAAQTCNN